MKNTFIDKNAILGNNIRIGNGVTIEEDVVIGNNAQIGNHVTILSGSRIGENCQIHSNAVLGGMPQDLKYKGEYTLLEIGDNNIIREFVTINKGTVSKGKTSIGNSNLIMSNAHIGHDCVIGNNCIIGFSVGMAGEVIVQDWANISGLTAIHQFSVIGEHAMISGLSRVVKDVPPYIIAAHEPLRFAGLNTVGLKRRGFDSCKIDELRSIYRVLFQEMRNTKFALELIAERFEETVDRNKILNFVHQSKRGIIKGFEF
ncbi:Acyl-(Acyl-carrier-protein)--UDP-N-acetylglucosamine O-acyltransferase [Flavobacterium anhuiense]|uniref:Acyl-(Acyl-carrier-protein)--UDP-N-acetylglucosamine O-acyltransferase n=1 Tax=Flavobacterium anhuiense TaxID=459526 RepID=A0A444VSG9_9FLAO|nr:acyl-ACP--UDP-N-acetylglucosamine O-acyltransferase [Flavobacterium anhuiense]RYJ36384.1 Acyl-(Acyl-carrier-protein)--UDP-N-acetylglucosamine O-acyltransferase [Flavobacterium anhuiense]